MTGSSVGEGLARVFAALNEWVDGLPIDWQYLGTQAVPLPPDVQQEDITRVALYGTSTQDVEMLCRQISLEDPKTSFAPLLLLSEMVPFAHPQQRSAVELHLEPRTVHQIAVQGHGQCRGQAGKLFLRVWGHLPEFAADMVRFIRNPQEIIRLESLRCVSDMVSTRPAEISGVRDAVAAVDWEVLDFIDFVFDCLEASTEAQVKNGAVLVLTWLLHQHYARWDNQRSMENVLRRIIQECMQCNQRNIQGALLHGIVHLCTGIEQTRMVYSCGGVELASVFLRSWETSTLHLPLPFDGSTETSFELLVKLLWQFLSFPDAIEDIKFNSFSTHLVHVINDEAFHTCDRYVSILTEYLTPLLAAINNDP